MNIKEITREIIEEFEMFEDWNDKYEFIINLGQELEGLEEQYHTNVYLIRGCQSQVWLRAYMQDDKIIYEADSDALIVKGLVALLLRVYSDQKPEEVLNNPPDFFNAVGLSNHLSPMRSNGLNEMIKKLNAYAEEFKK
ncbi:MAG: SufE family protein [Calditrichia bacterium]|nr:SufE family protein [Calditrichia bacterium]